MRDENKLLYNIDDGKPIHFKKLDVSGMSMLRAQTYISDLLYDNEDEDFNLWILPTNGNIDGENTSKIIWKSEKESDISLEKFKDILITTSKKDIDFLEKIKNNDIFKNKHISIIEDQLELSKFAILMDMNIKSENIEDLLNIKVCLDNKFLQHIKFNGQFTKEQITFLEKEIRLSKLNNIIYGD